MSEKERYVFEIILEHVNVCEKRFSAIKTPKDFIDNDYGTMLLDAIVTRLQAIGENIKRLIKNDSNLSLRHPDVNWDDIIKFRDFVSHHYEKLDYEVIFDICETDLPKLKKVLTEALDA